MDNLPQSARIAQLIGITSSAFISGAIISISAVAIPSLTTGQSPTPTAQLPQIWRTLFQRGVARMPALALLSCVTSAYAAYARHSHRSSPSPSLGSSPGSNHAVLDVHGNGNSWMYPTVTAVLTVAIVPFTLVFMGKTNARLLELAAAKGAEAGQRGLVLGLLGKWSFLNGVRGCLPLLGCIVGVSGLIGIRV